MRVAVIDKDRCQPKKCSLECIKYCPRVRGGVKVIEILEGEEKPTISEEICVGCGICIHKCPFKAIHIENLAEELKEDLIHQYGKNGFRIFRLPLPRKGKVVGLLGENGIGKTTVLQILSGKMIPNLGNFEKDAEWDEIIEKWRGTELAEFFKKVADEEIKISYKPQYIDKLSYYKGKVKDFIEEMGVRGEEIDELMEKEMSKISGGELQKIAITVATEKPADIYFFDEPSSYLDIKNRLEMAKKIRKLANDKMVMVVEHDLAVLDFLADYIHILYGRKGVYGIVAGAKGVRHGINLYLSGYLKEENVRFGEEIKFERHPPRETKEQEILISFEELKKEFTDFELEVEAGEIYRGEVVGVLGPNGIGKTTFVKMLAGIVEPTEGKIDSSVKVSYKPQYIQPFDKTVENLFSENKKKFHILFEKEVLKPLGIKDLFDKNLENLSGGELQIVSIALCLSLEADIYLIDEPSAYLDAKQRMKVAKVIKRVMEKEGKASLVVEHDVYFIDMVSQSLMVFSGEPGKKGRGRGPFSLREGMNLFLKDLGITFRRDEDTNRPRVNKIGSTLDREQKSVGEYYYEL
ncbi:MAG TPA: ribosome biogenesis/translation initiation ATPase RLI [Thermoplasmatales archaeon]|nr:ribosome biogenesis/translation initiation ATPase RLI [Thermoplasmatales archaeon]